MEKNNFNKAYIYIIAMFAIGIAISNIISFFGGVGFALVGFSILLILAIANILKDEQNKKRFGDLFVLIAIEFLLLIILFFAFDFNLNGITSKFPFVMRNICGIYSLIAIGYVVFRYISEVKGKRYTFVEYILGNHIAQPKDKKVKPSKQEIKKNKELENGTLAPKPSSIDLGSVEDLSAEENNEDEIEENEGKTEEKTEPSKTEPERPANRTSYWY